MKRYCTFFCFLIFLALLGINVSCSGEDSSDAPDPAPQPDPEITIPTGEDKVPVITDAGGEVTLKFTSATNWTLTTNTDWVKTQVSTGKGGEQTVLLTVLPNETPDERQATVTISVGRCQADYNDNTEAERRAHTDHARTGNHCNRRLLLH